MANKLQQWIHDISTRNNDSALLFVMFNDNQAYRGALYSFQIKNGRELMAQYSVERRVRAYCHLIKRAYAKGQYEKSTEYASELNDELSKYAESLFLMLKSVKPDMKAIHH